MKTKPIHEAGYPDLMRFAAESGLDVTYGKTKLADVRRLVEDAFGSDVQIPTGANDTEAKVEALPALTAHYRDDPKVTVVINSDPANGGSHAFPIMCGGETILVKRDTEVAIPYRFYEILVNAKETVIHQELNAAGNAYIEYETVQPAVRFSTMGRFPSPEEIAAFQERTKDLNREQPKLAA